MARGVALPAKLVRPTQSGTYRRARLFSQLDRCRPVCWVSGPPGAGKTTLVASFVEARRLRTLWYQVDEDDADVATLFYYLRQAAVRASPRRRWRLPLLTPEYVAGLGTFTRRWFEELFAALPRPFVLVFDNYHALPADSRVHEVVRDAIEILAGRARAIVVSRADPPPAFARLRAERAIALLEWDALRLTPKETAGIARMRTSRRVAAHQARALHAATDGWAAGVVLMLERASVPTEQAMRDARPRQAVFEYFASEILAGSDAETRQVLLETALMPKVTASQALTLTSSARAAEILANLARRRYFTDFHAEPEPTYQYHYLFLEFLRANGCTLIPDARRNELRRRASTLLETSGQIEDAAQVLLDARDWEGLTSLVLRHAPALLRAGRVGIVEKWLSAIPAAVVAGSPWLIYWLGACRLPFAPKESVARASEAFEGFSQSKDVTGMLAAASLAVDAILFDWEEFTALDRWIADLQRLLADREEPAPDSIEAQATASLFAALAWRRPDHPDIGAWVARTERCFVRSREPSLRARIGFSLGWYFMWLGAMAKAGIFVDAIRQLGQSEPTPLWPLYTMMLESNLAWINADVASCRRIVAQAVELAATAGIHVMDTLLPMAAIHGELVANDPKRARQLLDPLWAQVKERGLGKIAHCHYQAGWAALLEGNLQAAHAHAELAEQQITQAGAYFGIMVTRLAVAQTTFERGDHEAARKRLAEATRMARAMRSAHVEYMCLLVDAQFALVTGHEDAAADAVRRAFALGREHGFLAGAWSRRDVLARLAGLALERGIEVEYARKLVHVHRLAPDARSQALETWPWQIRIHALGTFEVEIDDRAVEFVGRAQRKPIELLKALVAFGGRAVTERQIADALWPDADGDLAQQSLAVTLHRLRKLLRSDEAIRRHEGRLDLDPQRVWTDVGALQSCLNSAAATDDRDRETVLKRFSTLYRGPLLRGDDAPWIVAPRERLRARFVRELGEVARAAEARGDTDRAIECYVDAIEADERAEELYRRLIGLYGRLGRRAEMLALYQRCRATLAATLGVHPSPETEAAASGPADLSPSRSAPAAPANELTNAR
jgi:ATP/maltotriose-dependent transcriptional regulator MalT/DNA-binding SARP family transcriptional activator